MPGDVVVHNLQAQGGGIAVVAKLGEQLDRLLHVPFRLVGPQRIAVLAFQGSFLGVGAGSGLLEGAPRFFIGRVPRGGRPHLIGFRK